MSDTIAALANRFWRVHPKEIQDLGITREQFYEREMRALVATAELRKLQDIIDNQADRILDQADRIEALEAALDRAVTRGLEQVEYIATLEAALNHVADMTYCGADAEWHFKAGYDPQAVLDALAPEQDIGCGKSVTEPWRE